MSAFSHDLGQVTYPRMERQDLTQAQLGSFKFTPTDEVRHVFAGASPRPAQQFTHYVGKDARPGRLLPRMTIAVSSSAFSSHESPASPISPTRVDPSFFNTYIKPDLAKSRLQLGVPAFRAAVDGAPSSPSRRSTDIESFHLGFPTDMALSSVPVREDGPSIPTEDHFPTFTPGDPSCAHVGDILTYTCLIRALSTEQQAHLVTKAILKCEKDARISAEAMATQLESEKQRLEVHNNMLKGIVQNNAKNEKLAAQKAVVDDFYDKVNAAGRPDTILHDAVKNLARPSVMKPGVNNISKSAVVHDADLYNFDLVESHGSPIIIKHLSLPKPQHTTSILGKRDENINPAETKHKAARMEGSNETLKIGGLTIADSPANTAKGRHHAALNALKGALHTEKEKGQKDANQEMNMPFNVQVNWSHEPIFEDSTDKFHRLGRASTTTTFGLHPVRYHPKKTATNLYRTTMIDFIPLGTTIREVLNVIRGGLVESIQLFGPIGRSTNFMTARIVFDYELAARGVYLHSQNAGIMISGQKVRVWQVLEPTYPREEQLEEDIFENNYTRLLLIEKAKPATLEKLPEKLERQMKMGHVIEIGESFDGIPMVEFTSVVEATKALKQFVADADFGGASFDFDDDPCMGSYPKSK